MTDESQENTNNGNKGCLPSLKHFVKRKQQNENVRETIEELIEEGAENAEDSFTEHEQLLLNNVLYLKDKKCCHVMVPRADIIAFHQDGLISDLAKLMVVKGHSRIPIYGDSLDDIVGILHIIDLALCLIRGQNNIKVKEIINNPVKFVSPEMRVLDLLREMQADKVHMAIVIDEYGGVDGIVTIEDLLEEIVGNIEDEYDFEEQHGIQVQNGIIIADARAELTEIKEKAGLDLEKIKEESGIEDVIETRGGLVFHTAQRIPSRGEIIDWQQGIKFRIMEVDPRRIKKVMILLPETVAEIEKLQKEATPCASGQ